MIPMIILLVRHYRAGVQEEILSGTFENWPTDLADAHTWPVSARVERGNLTTVI